MDSSGNYGYIKAGADTVTPFLTRTGFATESHVLSGYTFSNASSSGLTGTMPNIKDIDDALSAVYVEGGISGTGIYARMNYGAHITNAGSGCPELFIPQSQIATMPIATTVSKTESKSTSYGIGGYGSTTVTLYYSNTVLGVISYSITDSNNYAKLTSISISGSSITVGMQTYHGHGAGGTLTVTARLQK